MNQKLQPTLEREQQDMALLKVRRFSQITLPAEVRKKLHVTEGDYLEAEVVEDGVLLKPVSVVERQKAWDYVFKVLKKVHTKQPATTKSPRAQEEEITREIKAFRKEHAGSRS